MRLCVFGCVTVIASLVTVLVGAGSQPEAPKPAGSQPGTGQVEKGKSDPVEPAAPRVAGTARIEIVFVLDTTGSMAQLVEGAKQKIWSIANVVTQAKPRPQILIGLVAFRDRGDRYVTQITALTEDLDHMYSELMKLEADGGGDEPESVNQALDEALRKCQWSSGEDDVAPTLQIVYLVGDSPAHMDYPDDVKHEQSCRLAKEKGIIINTIQCGTNSRTTPMWKEIAKGAGGEFFQIAQSGGVRSTPTPYDEELSKLGRELEGTLLDYGDRKVMASQMGKRAAQGAIAMSAAPAAAADRVVFNSTAAGQKNLYGRQELVQDVADEKVKIENIPVDHLPEVMKKMSAAEREKFVKEKGAERARIRARIDEVSKKRGEFLRKEMAKSAKKDSFDEAVKGSMREQAAGAGIVMPRDE